MIVRPCVHYYIRLFIVALPLALASCGEDVLGPLNDTAFVLQTVDDQSLPATVSDEFGSLAWIVTADTIWFHSGSKWRRHSIQHREEGVGGDPLDVVTDGVVTRRDGILILDFECPDSGDCIVPDRLVENATFLEMANTFLHSGTRLVFAPI